jgi:type IV secretory pathway TraG/TraD family ATPase VirD4
MDPHRMAGTVRRVPRALAERVNEYLATLTPDQLSAVRGLGTRLAIITESHTGAYLEPGADPVDLRAALSGEQVVLFSLNSSRYGQLSAQLGALAVQDLVTAVGARLSETGREIQATIAIDEFSALRGDHVESLLTRGRESGASIILVTQELADLDRAARGLRDQVVGVTAVKIAHRQDVPSSAQLVAEIAGTETVWDHVYQSSGRAPFGRDRGRTSSRQVERFVIHPNEIKSLPTGQAVVITKLPEARARTVRITPPARRAAPAREGPEQG